MVYRVTSAFSHRCGPANRLDIPPHPALLLVLHSCFGLRPTKMPSSLLHISPVYAPEEITSSASTTLSMSDCVITSTSCRRCRPAGILSSSTSSIADSELLFPSGAPQHLAPPPLHCTLTLRSTLLISLHPAQAPPVPWVTVITSTSCRRCRPAGILSSSTSSIAGSELLFPSGAPQHLAPPPLHCTLTLSTLLISLHPAQAPPVPWVTVITSTSCRRCRPAGILSSSTSSIAGSELLFPSGAPQHLAPPPLHCTLTLSTLLISLHPAQAPPVPWVTVITSTSCRRCRPAGILSSSTSSIAGSELLFPSGAPQHLAPPPLHVDSTVYAAEEITSSTSTTRSMSVTEQISAVSFQVLN
ncbi:uncharacterized protein LOC142564573 [Dermacentor variabilis]|uniref:uncharacterized protein LOC142564573 n=1 Tax=Dermacentor variabilis TaxID=34621 RepID=UPI003F5B05BD